MARMTRTRLSLFTLTALAMSLPAFAQTPAAPIVTESKVSVQSTGTGTKRALRYKAAAGSKERLDMKMGMSLSIDMPGMGEQSMPAPSMTMAIDTDVTSAAPGGDIAFGMVVSSVSMDAEGLPAGLLDSVKGLTAAIVMDGRGNMKSMKFDDSKIADPMMKQVLSSSGLDRLAMPLPEEPVGVGARWQVTQMIDANGIRVDQVTGFEIVELTDTSATFAIAVTQSAPPQTVSPPGMPAGVEASVTGMSGTGTGKMTLVDGLLALIGDMNIKTAMTMDVSAGGQTQRLGTNTDVKLTLARGKRE